MLPARFGLIKTTLLDFPGLVAAVLFTPGCNLRCPWCQNPGLVHPPWAEDLWPMGEVEAFLEKRRAVLQGVVVTGGEPLFHPELEALLAAARSRGYRVKLDTNGTLPRRLERLDPATIDYLAIDVKNAPSRLAASAGLPVSAQSVGDTLALARDRWAGRFEVRLTWVPGLNRFEDLGEYAAFVGPGAPVWVQGYRTGAGLDPHFAARAPTGAELDQVAASLVEAGVDARVRA